MCWCQKVSTCIVISSLPFDSILRILAFPNLIRLKRLSLFLMAQNPSSLRVIRGSITPSLFLSLFTICSSSVSLSFFNSTTPNVSECSFSLILINLSIQSSPYFCELIFNTFQWLQIIKKQTSLSILSSVCYSIILSSSTEILCIYLRTSSFVILCVFEDWHQFAQEYQETEKYDLLLIKEETFAVHHQNHPNAKNRLLSLKKKQILQNSGLLQTTRR